jgi:hypothetical protein
VEADLAPSAIAAPNIDADTIYKHSYIQKRRVAEPPRCLQLLSGCRRLAASA